MRERSCSRSAGAVNLLVEAGYTKACNRVDAYVGSKAKDGPDRGQRAFNDWKNAGLSWTYSLNKYYRCFSK